MIVASRNFDHGPGPPYSNHTGICKTTCIKTTHLVMVDERLYGKRYYLTIDGTSKTWLSDKDAGIWSKG